MAKTIKIISLAAVLLLVVLAVPFPLTHVARAMCSNEIWVAPPPLGKDTNPGTQALPFATIHTGLIETCNGGTLHVAAGFYHENPLFIGGAITMIGAGAPITIIDGDGTDTVLTISSGPWVDIISGFTIQGGNSAVADFRNPADEQILYAGIKLPSIEMLKQSFSPSPLPCGGGVYIGDSHIVTLNDCTIKNNMAMVGGGICNRGQLYMNRCTVSGNRALDVGGGIYNLGDSPGTGQMWLTNCTISGNSAIGITDGGGQNISTSENVDTNDVTVHLGADGGGIYNLSTMNLLNCTIANNSAERYGGGFVNTMPDTAIFKNTIVANNTAGAPGTNNCYNPPPAVVTSLGHNLDSENSCGFNQTGDLINTDPMLGPLKDNGGPTFTCALLEGSPAIDAGDNSGAPPTDQRGISRPQGPAVDIGAYEFVPTEVTTTPTIPTTKTLPSSPPSTLNWTRNLNPPTMSVQFVSVSPQQVTANQPVTISTNVVNTGDEGGNLNVALKINGQVEQTRMVSVGPQATQPIKFTVTRAQPGTYNVAILDKSSSFTILGAGGTTGTPANTGLIVILIIGVLVIASVMVLLLSRRPA